MANTLNFGNGKWGAKKDSILAYNDENANFKPLPFTTSRASTATRINKAGLIEKVENGIPRVDYLGNTKGALLLEPQRTNLLTYSNDFAGSGYNKNSFVALANQGISPEGLNNASLIYQTANGDRDFYVDTPNREDVFSVYAKSSGKDFFVIFSKAGTNPAWYNLANGTLGTVPTGTTATITPAGNGWYRLTYYRNVAGVYQFFKPIDSNGSAVGTASGTDGALIYGAQLESGKYSTSYIPNNGESAGVTRLKDLCIQTPISGIIGQTEGVVFMDFIAQNSTGFSQSHFWLGVSGNEIGFFGGSQFIFYSSGGVSINGGNIVSGTRYKVAFGYKANDYVAYINGSQVGSDTSATVPATLSGLSVNSYFNGIEVQKKNINNFKLYNAKLSNSELEALTTI